MRDVITCRQARASRVRWLSWLFAVLMVVSCYSSVAEQRYDLSATQVTENIYVVLGSTEHFSMHNGGNIANTAFIQTAAGVIVIDTGPSALYGTALRELIERTTAGPVIRVYNTHHHPDHYFGNQAFADVPIYALQDTRREMEQQAAAFSDNLYRLLGTWMKGTEPHLPTFDVTPGVQQISDRELEFFAYRGHSGGDLVILDHQDEVLFVGDLVFHERAPTTPSASLDVWQHSLGSLRGTRFRYMVPGHGPVAESVEPINNTADYLRWLAQRIDGAVSRGDSMAETLFQPIPSRFRGMATLTDEYRRSVMHVFPDVEHNFFHGESPDNNNAAQLK